MLEIKMVTTSSEGCSCPNCRFPMTLIPTIKIVYKIKVRKKEINNVCRFLSQIRIVSIGIKNKNYADTILEND